MAECPLGSVSVITEPPEEMTAATLKTAFKTLGGMTERYCVLEHL